MKWESLEASQLAKEPKLAVSLTWACRVPRQKTRLTKSKLTVTLPASQERWQRQGTSHFLTVTFASSRTAYNAYRSLRRLYRAASGGL